MGETKKGQGARAGNASKLLVFLQNAKMVKCDAKRLGELGLELSKDQLRAALRDLDESLKIRITRTYKGRWAAVGEFANLIGSQEDIEDQARRCGDSPYLTGVVW